ncbi:MAG: holo-ACP synthase [Chloroflexota bacterium]|nr:holo-ACP synthase [Chloroflexota bacterium]
MKIYSGIDTIEISRLDQIKPQIKERFIRRVYTDREIAQAQGRSEVLSGLFAAKESVSKALGTGIGYVQWRDIEIIHLPTGQPTLALHGNAKIVANQLGIKSWSVSISHDRDKAIALAVAIGE